MKKALMEITRRLPQALIFVFIIGLTLREYRIVGRAPFYIFFLLLSIGASIELARLLRPAEHTRQIGVWLCGMILPIMATIAIAGQRQIWQWNVNIRTVTLWCLCLFIANIGVMITYIAYMERELRIAKRKNTSIAQAKHSTRRLLAYYTAVFYIGLPIALTVLFSPYRNGLSLILYAMAFTILFDTSSYLCGSLLAQKGEVILISPKKSAHGYIGGTIITGIAVTVFLINVANINLSVGLAIVFACATIASAIIGDLFESALKRSVQKKDSGTLVRGRGGLLDSFDSHLVSIPTFCALALWAT